MTPRAYFVAAGSARMRGMRKIFGLLAIWVGTSAMADIKQFAWERYQQEKAAREDETWALAPKALTFTQKIDHANPADTRTFEQRYYFDSSLAKGKDSPVLFYLCGEATCGPGSLNGAIRAHAKKHQAHLVALEHRYYGKSQPFKTLAVASLKYLTSENALADAAAFQKWLSQKEGLTGKWVVVGGSYAGVLAARYRLHYPDLAVGALASSAPVLAKELFEEYDHHIYKVIDPACAAKMQGVVKKVEASLTDPSARAAMMKKFGAQMLKHDVDFLYWVADIAAFAVQYGMKDDFCRAINQGDAVDGYARFAATIEFRFGIDAEKDSPAGAMSEDPADYEAFFGMRGWWYQTCTEFGYWQVAYSDTKESTRSSRIDLVYHRDVCKRLFGITVPPDNAGANQRSFAPLLDAKTQNIFFTNGSNDPWMRLSLAGENGNATNPEVDYATILGAAHCDDLGGASPNDSASLRDARTKFGDLIGDWLK